MKPQNIFPGSTEKYQYETSSLPYCDFALFSKYFFISALLDFNKFHSLYHSELVEFHWGFVISFFLIVNQGNLNFWKLLTCNHSHIHPFTHDTCICIFMCFQRVLIAEEKHRYTYHIFAHNLHAQNSNKGLLITHLPFIVYFLNK